MLPKEMYDKYIIKQPEYPFFTLKERDRRWAVTRKLMKEKGLDALIVPGLMDREMWESWLAYEHAQGTVIFPLEGEPVYLTHHGSKVGRHVENSTRRGIVPWIEDWRNGPRGPDWIAVLKEKGLEAATIGVVGLTSRAPFSMEGYMNYTTWKYVLEQLPKATFIEVSGEYTRLQAVTSEETRSLLRHCANIAELAAQAMLDVIKPGVTEEEIFATIMAVITLNGAWSLWPPLRVGPKNVGAGYPNFLNQGRKHPYVMQKGDVAGAEIFCFYGGTESQVQMTVAVEPVNEVTMKCAEVARRSYEAGCKTLRPGITYDDVLDAMEKAVSDAGCWHMGPLIHPLPFGWAHSYLNRGAEEWRKRQGLKGILRGEEPAKEKGVSLQLEPWMCFEFEPNACMDDMRVNVGGTMLVTEDGCEELNKLATDMHVVTW
ncbi:MAG: M24 family metallopeptidase [Candidatus Latescibacteria bacterium]|nr:M24 family metallopeptidase [Candidatus Latescibacterota bacterium]